MDDNFSLLYRMENREPLDPLLQPQLLDHQPSQSHREAQEVQTPSLLARMSSPQSQRRLPLNRISSTETPLSTAMPLSNDIERGKFPKQLSTSSSSQDSSQPLEMTEPGLMLPS